MTNILKEIRKNHNLTQTELANELEVSRSAIALIESGKNNLSVDLSKKIASKYNVSLDVLLNQKENVINDNLIGNIYDNPNKIPNSNFEDDFITNSFETLLKLDEYILSICKVISLNTTYEFAQEEVDNINKTKEAKDLVMDLIFNKKQMSNRDKLLIINTIKLSESLLEKYINELTHSIGSLILTADELLSPKNINEL